MRKEKIGFEHLIKMAESLSTIIPRYPNSVVISISDLAKKLGTTSPASVEYMLKLITTYLENYYEGIKSKNPSEAEALLNLYIPEILKVSGKKTKATRLVPLSVYLSLYGNKTLPAD